MAPISSEPLPVNGSIPATGNNASIIGNTTVRVPSSAILYTTYKTDPNWAKVDTSVKTADPKVSKSL